ncbi:MAG TPA: glycosyltransferase family 4 protein [Nocardioidaceae bacterium]|nr:glycosyltransferase family 4 protein [Nocardioidaceae bacterium]
MDVHVVAPDGMDDPLRPSGGNVYDRRLCNELAALGWSVKEHHVRGTWPTPAPTDLAALGEVVSGIPDGASVVLDGLVALTAPEVLVREADRLRLVVLVHMPLSGREPWQQTSVERAREGAVLAAAAAVVTPSTWTRRLVLDRHAIRPELVHVARPGADRAAIAPGTKSGGELLCVGSVTPDKGHDVLLAALGTIRHLTWRCTCVGSLDADPAFVDLLRRQADELEIGDRLRTTGPLAGARLDEAYATADLLVTASRAETYGMVVTEALAHGLPVVATEVGGLPEALGWAPGSGRPGLMVPVDAPAALADALRAWLGDPELRIRLRCAAEERRATLSGWPATAETVSRVLAEVA